MALGKTFLRIFRKLAKVGTVFAISLAHFPIKNFLKRHHAKPRRTQMIRNENHNGAEGAEGKNLTPKNQRKRSPSTRRNNIFYFFSFTFFAFDAFVVIFI